MQDVLLNIKYRPKTFADVIGQPHIAKILKRSIELQKIAPAYLFVGPSGCGKTSIARIYAMALLCEKRIGSEPCGECDFCTEILDQTSFNYREIDGASSGGVDDMRRLVSQSSYGTIRGNRQVVYVDECFWSANRVMLEDGSWERIGKIVNEKLDKRVLAYSYRDGKFVPRKIMGYLRKKREQNWHELEFVFGRALLCTPNHEVYTPLGKVRADSLVEGDVVLQHSKVMGPVQLQCVLGSLLGDATLGRDPCERMVRFCFKQSDKQKGYLHLKQRIMSPFVRTKATKRINGGWGDFVWPVNTICTPEFTALWEKVYTGVTKKGHPARFVTQEWLNQINEIGLAFFFMDDGSMSWNKTSKGLTPGGFQFSTHCFSKQENYLLKQWFKERWDIDTEVAEDSRGKGFYISSRGGKHACEKLLALILPYIHEDHKHKVADRKFGHYWRNHKVEAGFGLAPVRIRYSGPARAKEMKRHNWVYCLEVEEDHNFLCEGTLVSNCHMISKAGQNAILKLLEDGSLSTTYFFATTEPEKILHTVRARCMELRIRPIFHKDIADRLEHICKIERLPYERQALDMIALHTKSHVRDAINQMEQLTHLGDLTVQSVSTNLNMALEQQYCDLILHLKEKPQETMSMLEDLTKRASVREIYQGLAEVLLAAVKLQMGIAPATLVEKESLMKLYELYGQALLQAADKLAKSYQQSRTGLICDLLQLRALLVIEVKKEDKKDQKVDFQDPMDALFSDLKASSKIHVVTEVNKDVMMSIGDFAKALGGRLEGSPQQDKIRNESAAQAASVG